MSTSRNMASMNQMSKWRVTDLCLPALIYLILAIVQTISSLIYMSPTFLATVGSVVMIVIWTWLLNFICKAGYPIVSWILVIAPFILVIIMLLFFREIYMSLTEAEKKEVAQAFKEGIKEGVAQQKRK